jgi:alpha-glucosidase/alpha-D-xyloside xylohydrolase
MPYWSFGFHQCRWGYKNVSDLKNVVESYKKANIPLDTMWNDIDYMENYLDFTTDSDNYPEEQLRSFVEELHANGQHYVLILDPGISMAYDNYSTLQRGLADDVFLKDEQNENYLAQVWPGPVYFPDFLNPKTKAWWVNEVAEFHTKVPFDGLWIDMNEVSNFCSGTQCKFDGVVYHNRNDCYLKCQKPSSKYDDPPYKIVRAGAYENIGDKTVAMTVKHYDGTIEYNSHNLYGLSESIATNEALVTARKKRPFILSRSTFVGSGVHTAHWTGDNAATFKDLEESIASILNSGLLGLPMVGADICGFDLNTTEELCNRWIQLGAFYPFARSHNINTGSPQEPYLWELVARSARSALGLRYRLLPYFYTLMFESHNRGSPIARPLFFAFPDDPKTLQVSNQFMIGSGVLVTPVTQPKVTSVNGYFPKGTWYNLFDHSKLESGGEHIEVPAPLDSINVHVHEGTVLPMQEGALTSTAVKSSPFTLLVAFSDARSSGYARGKLFIDNGDDVEMVIRKGRSSFVSFVGQQSEHRGALTTKVVSGDYAIQQGLVVQDVVIFGVNGEPTSVSIDGKPVDSGAVAFDAAVPSVTVSRLRLSVGIEFELEWTTQAALSSI